MTDIDQSIELERRYQDPILDTAEQRLLPNPNQPIQDICQTSGGLMVSSVAELTPSAPELDEAALVIFCRIADLDIKGMSTVRQILLTQPHGEWFSLGWVKIPGVENQLSASSAAHKRFIAKRLTERQLLVHNGLERGGSKFMIDVETVRASGLFGDSYDPSYFKTVGNPNPTRSSAPKLAGKKQDAIKAAASRMQRRRASSEVVDYNLLPSESGPDTGNPIISYIIDGKSCTEADLTVTNLRKALSQLAGGELLNGQSEITARYSQIQELYARSQQGIEVGLGSLAVEMESVSDTREVLKRSPDDSKRTPTQPVERVRLTEEEKRRQLYDFCSINPVASFIVFDTPLEGKRYTHTDIAEAYSRVSEADFLTDPNIASNLRVIRSTMERMSGELAKFDDFRSQVDRGDVDSYWQIFSNCAGVDPGLFFPERGASTKEAKAVCQGCVVREDCLEYALARGETFGIWGGLSERERRRIRRQRALARSAQQARRD